MHAQITAGPETGSVSTSFTIAHQYTVSQKQFPINPGDSHAIQHYISAPALQPSSVKIVTAAKPTAAPGDLFLAPYQGKGMAGPMITDQAGNLIWFHPLPANTAATNFQVQQYQGKPVLTWWQGRILEVGFGQGETIIANDAYEQIARIRAGNGYRQDLHEIRLMPDGTAWIDAFDPIKMNLSSLHGLSNGVLTDSVIEKIDIKTGLVMWEWHAVRARAAERIPQPRPQSQLPLGLHPHQLGRSRASSNDLLLSSRNTWTVYDVDLHSGAIRWRLGGSHSSFKGPSSTRFYWQHDAEFQPGGVISVFDNAANPPKEKQSRGLLLSLNQGKPHGQPEEGLHQPVADAAGLEPGEHAQPARRQLAAGLRRPARLHRVRCLRSRHPRRASRQERPGLQDLSLALDGPSQELAGSRRQAQRRRRAVRLGQLERRDRGRLLARPGGQLARARWRPSPTGRRRALRRPSPR